MKRSYQEEPFFLPEESFNRGISRRRGVTKRSGSSKIKVRGSCDDDRHSSEKRGKYSPTADRYSFAREDTGYPPVVARIPNTRRSAARRRKAPKARPRGVRLSVWALALIWISGVTVGGLTMGILGMKGVMKGILGGMILSSLPMMDGPLPEPQVSQETVFSVASAQNPTDCPQESKISDEPAERRQTADTQRWSGTGFGDIPVWERGTSPAVAEMERPLDFDAGTAAGNSPVISSASSETELASAVSSAPVQVSGAEAVMSNEPAAGEEAACGWDQLADSTVGQVSEQTVVNKPEIPMKNEVTPFDPSIGFAAYNTDPNSIYMNDTPRPEADLPMPEVASRAAETVPTQKTSGRFADYRIQTGGPKTTAMLPQGGGVH
ncbi:MAG: hypothetical protein J6S75_05775 [Thermoguttaceae bacterium]|nr:hypothetical protein [Thermoguttaceae bacterium]